MLKDARECLAAALLVMGKSINETDPAMLKEADEACERAAASWATVKRHGVIRSSRE